MKNCSGKYQLKQGQEIIAIDPNYFRPTEVELLIGDSTKAQQTLNWKPKYDLKSLVKEMVQEDVKLFEKDLYLKEGGHSINTPNE